MMNTNVWCMWCLAQSLLSSGNSIDRRHTFLSGIEMLVIFNVYSSFVLIHLYINIYEYHHRYLQCIPVYCH